VLAALCGVNAAVVGILAAALYDPVALGAIKEPGDLLLVAAGLALLIGFRLPPWLVVLGLALAGFAVDRI
jgi:chromate transporter